MSEQLTVEQRRALIDDLSNTISTSLKDLMEDAATRGEELGIPSNIAMTTLATVLHGTGVRLFRVIEATYPNLSEHIKNLKAGA